MESAGRAGRSPCLVWGARIGLPLMPKAEIKKKKDGKGCLLLFGASGAIGSAICRTMLDEGWRVVAVARKPSPKINLNDAFWIYCDPLADDFDSAVITSQGPFDAVCWAQGSNLNDSAITVDIDQHEALYCANVLYIVKTLSMLARKKALRAPARLCVISSVWQTEARPNKYSYTITKAALQGLVLAAAADLAEEGHLINAVLPGALDTPMTRANLAPDQIDKLSRATPFNRLPQLSEVATLVSFLCSAQNTGITGQFIAADLGFRNVHVV